MRENDDGECSALSEAGEAGAVGCVCFEFSFSVCFLTMAGVAGFQPLRN